MPSTNRAARTVEMGMLLPQPVAVQPNVQLTAVLHQVRGAIEGAPGIRCVVQHAERLDAVERLRTKRRVEDAGLYEKHIARPRLVEPDAEAARQLEDALRGIAGAGHVRTLPRPAGRFTEPPRSPGGRRSLASRRAASAPARCAPARGIP